MFSREILTQQLNYTISKPIESPKYPNKYSGKVRECFLDGDRRILITSDRLSCFDKIITTIPFKGQLLNSVAEYWFDATKDIIQNHIIARPHPNVWVAREVEIIPIEVIIRGYITGSAWRDYQAGKTVSGIKFPTGMKKHQKLDTPVITPSTKAASGHDMPISTTEIVQQGIVSEKLWKEIEEVTCALYAKGVETAKARNLILVDTKYEFGLLNGKLVLADEVHTQDSSRYWVLDSYQPLFDADKEPENYDKEFARSWLIERGYMGDGEIPPIDNDFRINVALKYIEAYERITGKQFEAVAHPSEEEVIAVLNNL